MFEIVDAAKSYIGNKVLSPYGEEFAGSSDSFALYVIARQEFKPMAQTIAIAHQRPQF
jgi:hypothetical protein